MAVDYNQAGHGSPSSLKAVALEVIPNRKRGGSGLKKLLQRETFWIVTLNATKSPGLNDGVDFLSLISFVFQCTDCLLSPVFRGYWENHSIYTSYTLSAQ